MKPERKFYIVDIGSVYGTYIKVSKRRDQILENKSEFMIGADSKIFVEVRDLLAA